MSTLTTYNVLGVGDNENEFEFCDGFATLPLAEAYVASCKAGDVAHGYDEGVFKIEQRVITTK
jgi:hypothetical protein